MEAIELLRIEHIEKYYGGEKVLDIPELVVHRGEQVGLVGNNGAGKTTLFRIILDLVKPENGKVWSKENNISKTEKWKLYTSSYLDEHFLIEYLTPEEYFQFNANINHIPEEEVHSFIDRLKGFFHEEIIGKNKYIRSLSQGNKKKVGIAAALMNSPELLLLDEPFANLDPSTQIRLKQFLKEHTTEKSITSFISSHDLIHVAEVCDRIIVLEKGKIIKDIKKREGTLQELENYFGEQAKREI